MKQNKIKRLDRLDCPVAAHLCAEVRMDELAGLIREARSKINCYDPVAAEKYCAALVLCDGADLKYPTERHYDRLRYLVLEGILLPEWEDPLVSNAAKEALAKKAEKEDKSKKQAKLSAELDGISGAA